MGVRLRGERCRVARRGADRLARTAAFGRLVSAARLDPVELGGVKVALLAAGACLECARHVPARLLDVAQPVAGQAQPVVELVVVFGAGEFARVAYTVFAILTITAFLAYGATGMGKFGSVYLHLAADPVLNQHLCAALIIGITGIYVVMLGRVLRAQGLLRGGLPWRQHLQARELTAFALPMFGSDMVLFLRNTFVVVLLQHFKDAVTVASFQAVAPVARLTLVVRESFVYLFVPTAARLHARGDRRGVEDLYCQTTMWVTLLSFPVFIVTFALAGPVTVLLFGSRYADSGPILALVSVGHFLNAASGTSLASACAGTYPPRKVPNGVSNASAVTSSKNRPYALRCASCALKRSAVRK